MKCKILSFNMAKPPDEIEREIESKIKDLEVILVTQSESIHPHTAIGDITYTIWYE